jgi:hypothetical protein
MHPSPRCLATRRGLQPRPRETTSPTFSSVILRGGRRLAAVRPADAVPASTSSPPLQSRWTRVGVGVSGCSTIRSRQLERRARTPAKRTNGNLEHDTPDRGLERFARWIRTSKEREASITLDVNVVEHHDVDVRVQVQARAKSVHKHCRAGLRRGDVCSLRPRPIVDRKRLGRAATTRPYRRWSPTPASSPVPSLRRFRRGHHQEREIE